MDSMDSNLIALIFSKANTPKLQRLTRNATPFFATAFFHISLPWNLQPLEKVKTWITNPCLVGPIVWCLSPYSKNIWILSSESAFFLENWWNDIWKSKVDTIIVQESYPAFKKRTSFVSGFLFIRTLKRNLYIHLAEHFEARNVTFRNLMKFPPHSSFLFKFS